jgi:alpha-ketoglutarate-dependent taurine dioxygenase
VKDSEPGAFPFVVRSERQGASSLDALLDLVREQEALLSQHLLRHGAILFRGFAIHTADGFAAVVATLSAGRGLAEYRGGASPRAALSAGAQPIYNSTEYPAHIALSLHRELSYSDAFPDRIYFLCLTAAASGGETTIGDSRRILARMPSELRARFEAKGVRYIRNLHSGAGSGYSWQDAFGTANPAEAERLCAAMGAESEWIDGDVLRVMQTRPAIAVHPITGEEVWFNQADGFHPSALDPASYTEQLAWCGSEDRFRLNATYGDGGPIPKSDLAAARAVIAAETRPHAWQDGDILMLDNRLAAHGRRPFRGDRRIAVAIT